MAGIYEYISYEWLRIKVATNSWDICYEVATYYKWHHYMVPIDAQGCLTTLSRDAVRHNVVSRRRSQAGAAARAPQVHPQVSTTHFVALASNRDGNLPVPQLLSSWRIRPARPREVRKVPKSLATWRVMIGAHRSRISERSRRLSLDLPRLLHASSLLGSVSCVQVVGSMFRPSSPGIAWTRSALIIWEQIRHRTECPSL